MRPSLDTSGGCGGGCQCSGDTLAAVVPRINGVALLQPHETLSGHELLLRAHTELLRQEAVRQGRLPAQAVDHAPELADTAQQAIEAMLDEAIVTPEPDEAACLRTYQARKQHHVVGQSLHVRHILFAVTPGVDVHALAKRAESALLELSRKEVPPQRFEALARELSNCPSGAQGGDLGWLTPDDCAPELANELFFQSDSGWGMGVHPRLVHTRYGFHIIEVLGRRKGQQLTFEQVRDRIAHQLTQQARATALRQYMQLLVGQAQVEGIELQGSETPLVQ